MKYKRYQGLGIKILSLRAEGKTYNEIVSILGCSKSIVSYHCGPGQKHKHKTRQKKNKKSNYLCRKIWFFNKRTNDKIKDFHRERNPITAEGEERKYLGKCLKRTFTKNDFISKYQTNPICYLTGRKIDLYKPHTYSFDHIIPVCKGGESTLENLGITCMEANVAKQGLLLEDFLALCKEILIHNGYNVTDGCSKRIGDRTNLEN